MQHAESPYVDAVIRCRPQYAVHRAEGIGCSLSEQRRRNGAERENCVGRQGSSKREGEEAEAEAERQSVHQTRGRFVAERLWFVVPRCRCRAIERGAEARQQRGQTAVELRSVGLGRARARKSKIR